MIGVERLLGVANVAPNLRAFVPRYREHPIEVVADDRRLGRHRTHRAELLQLGQGLVPRFLREARRVDAPLQFRSIVAAVLALAQLLLYRLHLPVEVVLALRLLHLPLDAVPVTLTPPANL